MTIDTRDRKIIRELQANARLTNVELAERVGLSPSNCLRRTKALEGSGLIRGYTAILDAKGAGLNVIAYVMIDLDQRAETDARAFRDAIEREDAIIECSAITGSSDMIAKVMVRDIEALGELTMNTLLKLPSVRSVTSCIVVKCLKSSVPIVC